MTTTEKLTIDDMVRRAVDDRLYMDKADRATWTTWRGGMLVTHHPNPVHLMPGVAMSYGLQSVLRQSDDADCSIFWLVYSIASWITCGGIQPKVRGFNEDGVNESAYADLLSKWPSMKHHQEFELGSDAEYPAELRVMGGHSDTEDETTIATPIQRFWTTDFPFGKKPFGVWAIHMQVQVPRQLVWTLMLPAEY